MPTGLTPFLTGSHAYGTPNESSDVDLAMLVDAETVSRLNEISDQVQNDYLDDDKDAAGYCFRFGRLNILAFTDIREYSVWRRVTNELVEKKPVTREYAVDSFRKAMASLKEE